VLIEIGEITAIKDDKFALDQGTLLCLRSLTQSRIVNDDVPNFSKVSDNGSKFSCGKAFLIR
jgi:hypothetical protein